MKKSCGHTIRWRSDVANRTRLSSNRIAGYKICFVFEGGGRRYSWLWTQNDWNNLLLVELLMTQLHSAASYMEKKVEMKSIYNRPLFSASTKQKVNVMPSKPGLTGNIPAQTRTVDCAMTEREWLFTLKFRNGRNGERAPLLFHAQYRHHLNLYHVDREAWRDNQDPVCLTDKLRQRERFPS